MKKVIVTGANGFVGSAFVKELLSHGIQVIAVDRDGCHFNLPQREGLTSCSCELSEISSLYRNKSTEGADTFFHFAWAGSAGAARADTVLQLQNAQWTIDSIRAAKNIGCQRFVCAGSIMEHETIAAAFAQENRPGMGYIYGSGKLVAHTMCKSIAAEIGIDLIWTKITNAYGAGELSPRFVNTTIRKILHDEPLQFTSGTQNYDFVYISDVARAFYLIGEFGKPFCDYLIGSSCARPLREFILEMKYSIAPNKDFIFGDIPYTGINLPLSDFDCSRTEQDTGFRAEVSFSEGVKKTMEWLKQMED